MPESITPLLAERLDISEDKAQSLLETMVEELRQRAETDGVQLSGLGTFREEEGSLVFEPGPALRRRVNQQFEGLSEEPLVPPEEAEMASADDSASGPTDTPDSTEPEPPPFMQPKGSPDSADTEEASDPAPAATDTVPADTTSRREDDSLDSFTVISLVLIGAFVLGAGWFVLDRANVWGPASTSPTATQSSPPQEAPSASDDGRTTDAAPSDTQSSPTTPSTDPAPTARNWTIVVASSTTRSAAQEVADMYASQFDSVAVVAGTVDDRTWYRVAIGRYRTEEEAEQTLADRADALPPDAWTHRLE